MIALDYVVNYLSALKANGNGGLSWALKKLREAQTEVAQFEADKKELLEACERALYWFGRDIALTAAQLEEIKEAAEEALMHLRGSVCECGFHLEDTDAADVLKKALGGE